MLEYVYLNLDGGYAFNLDQFDLTAGAKYQASIGYSFDSFNIQAGYHLQKQKDFNLTNFSLGAYFRL